MAASLDPRRLAVAEIKKAGIPSPIDLTVPGAYDVIFPNDNFSTIVCQSRVHQNLAAGAGYDTKTEVGMGQLLVSVCQIQYLLLLATAMCKMRLWPLDTGAQ